MPIELLGGIRTRRKSLVLLSFNVEDFCILSTAGVGGLGKTALAQLVFNDEKIKKEFPDSTYRLWVCVSNEDKEQFDETAILCKILELVTKVKPDNNSTKEFVQKEFQEKMRGKKYVLVLDDVWNEDREKWSRLEDFLRMGDGGSKIIVTTRSEQTAKIIDNKHVYRLDGLSQEYSHHLFEMSAFGEEKNNEYREIGEKIVRKCHRNPLAIKVIGSLLYGQDLSKRELIEKSELADISEGSDKILPILKLSYYNLAPLLKSCFSYCALFPKDFQMDNKMLISLWIAQGYVVEDVAEQYFLILMRRCFFQDVQEDRYGNIVSVKIHDLMHDVAQEVSKEEISDVSSGEINLGEKDRHVNIISDGIANLSLCSRRIRSYISRNKMTTCSLWEYLTTLRVLDLSYSDFTSLPQMIDRLLLLRYLNLGHNRSLVILPDSITKTI
ncbi:putative disease resistance protein RGA3 [Amaranthus tricolor]|uniref:putative disease resistance protein RGA3 n=1 Tax=Amaranthus tricolor TaxID=29722 RepID=UPI0025854802|nr:putative disease resistance protein RGA3 [Amaranthus tricolor]XP_057520960.1 putative disease resistance protein RGA3 [Amaranthus tricolor]